MKYGKEFQQILDDPSIPAEWKSSAIEYRRLKKLIKDVVAELSTMGLSPQILQKLLVTESSDPPASTDGKEDDGGDTEEEGRNGNVLEFHFESDEASPTFSTAVAGPSTSPQLVAIDPLLTGQSSNEYTESRKSASSRQDLNLRPTHNRTFRLRLLFDSNTTQTEDEEDNAPAICPMGVMDMVRSQSQKGRNSMREQKVVDGGEEKDIGDGICDQRRGRKVVRKAIADSHGGVKAEYVLVGKSGELQPQLRLHLSTTPSPDPHNVLSSSPSPAQSRSSGDYELEATTSEPDDNTHSHDPRPQKVISPHMTPRAFSKSPLMTPKFEVIPPSPTLQKLRKAISPIWALASGANIHDGLKDLSLNANPETVSHDHLRTESDWTSTSEVTKPANSPTRERDFIIPLTSDVEFFNLLTTALNSLSAFHASQQESFRQAVESLCGMISSSIQPGNSSSIQVMPTPLTTTLTSNNHPSSSSSLAVSPKGHKTKASKKDLYTWREIFTIWIESEIFESNSERTRGERTVEQASARLTTFANEVVKRGLGDRRTMKGKKVRSAWEEFLRLNVLLLDLKRFQVANIIAARKILKKHDKCTALTASTGFPTFVRSTLSSSFGSKGDTSTWTFYNTSLPHILLASLTDTLLPILPSLDDYACLICTGIAFKPIRLGCGHLFCVRCLVKMQRAGKRECPLCRSQVVLLADKTSLDTTLMDFMKEWFPKEVKEKQKDNEREIAKEQIEEMGLDAKCLVM